MKKIFFILFLIRSAVSFSQWNTDPSINTPVCTTPVTNQMFHQMAPDGNGGVIICWMEITSINTAQVYAQHLSNNGTLQWGAAGVPICPATQVQTAPRIVPDGSGGAIISWMDNRGGVYKYYAQKISAAGQLQWPVDGVPVCPAASLFTFTYKLISDGKGGAIVIWDDTRNVGTQIFGQRISPGGQLLWAPDGLACSPQNVGYSVVDAIADTTGGMILSWPRVNIATNNDIYVQRVTGDGILQWGVNGKNICAAPKDQLWSLLISDGKGGAIVVWQDFRKDPDLSQIYGQRVSIDGNEYWTENGALLRDSLSPAITIFKVVSDSAGGGIFTWLADFIQGQSQNANIYAQRFDSTGATLWPGSIVAALQDFQMPVDFQMALDGKHGSFITWINSTNLQPVGDEAADVYDVYAQHILSTGVTEWANTGFVVSSAPMNQSAPQIVGDTNGTAIIAWTDLRSASSYDIYAARLVSDISLPVKWLHFTAKRNGSSSILSWSTGVESNNKGFEVERSADGFRFNRIGFVAGHGNSTLSHSYAFTDTAPLEGRNYYRLRQVDIDGKVNYSKIILLEMLFAEGPIIYPNPASTILRVRTQESYSMLYILNSAGVVVKTKAATGQRITEINISDLPAGIYYLKVSSGNRNTDKIASTFMKE